MSDPGRRPTGPPAAGPVTTAAQLVRLREQDDSTGLLFEGRSWTWREVVAEAELRAELLLSLREDGPVPRGGPVGEHPRVPVPAGRGGAGRGGDRRDQPHPPGGRAGHRHPPDRLPAAGHRLDPGGTGRSPGPGPRRRPPPGGGRRHLRRTGWRVRRPPGTRPRPALSEPTPDQLYLLIFTSGSTGGPKAVRMTQGRAARAAARVPFSSDDVLYSAMPLFHGNALSAAVLPALASGATLALRRRFSASSFLPDVRESGATFFNSVGRAIAHIVATPPTEHDRDHRLRYVLGPGDLGPGQGGLHRAVRGPPRSRGTGRARTPSCSGRCPTPGPGPSVGPAPATTSPWSTRRAGRSCPGPSSTSTGG